MNILGLIDKYVELSTRCTELNKNKDISEEKEKELSSKFLEASETLVKIEELIPELSTLEIFRLIDVLNAKMNAIAQDADNRLIENSKREIYYYSLFDTQLREEVARRSEIKKTK